MVAASRTCPAPPTLVALALLLGQSGHADAWAVAFSGSRASPAQVTPAFVRSAALGRGHSCGRTDEAVLCWGDSTYGQLGVPPAGVLRWPVVVAGLLPYAVDSVATGWDHTCAVAGEVRSTRAVYCWGRNSGGQLGDGTTQDRSSPVAASGLYSATIVAAGAAHTCAITLDKELYCWGSNSQGQLGDGTTANKPTPTQVPKLTVHSVSAGGSHTCAVTDSAAVFCWGSNQQGQLGDGSTTDRSSPVQVPGLQAASVAAGWQFTCALTTVGGVSCWGSNSQGQLGRGSSAPQPQPSPAPVAFPAGSKLSAIALGGEHACALAEAGAAVYCWGAGSEGQLGVGNAQSQPSPQQVVVAGPSESLTLVTGYQTTAAVYPETQAFIWGTNANGQLGDGTANGRDRPSPLVDLETCKLFTQNDCKNGYLVKANAGAVWGWNMSTCCEQSCALFGDCGAGYLKKPNASSRPGSDRTACCDQLCSSYTCGAGYTKKDGVDSLIATNSSVCCDKAPGSSSGGSGAGTAVAVGAGIVAVELVAFGIAWFRQDERSGPRSGGARSGGGVQL